MKRKLTSLLISLLLICALVLQVGAIQEEKIIQYVDYSDEYMRIFCSDILDQDREYQVTLDGHDLPVVPSEIRAEDIPVTVFCLVDLSASRRNKLLLQKQDILTQLSAHMDDRDTLIITPASADIRFGDPLRSKQDRTDAIADLQETKEPTNLYGGILESLRHMTGSNEYDPYRVLVVLSDGVDDMDNGPTEKEIISAVEELRMPVYTVALTEYNQNTDETRTLSSFARSSYGGLALSNGGNDTDEYNRDEINGEEFGEIIWNSLQNMDILKADLHDIQVDRQKTDVKLSVRYTLDSASYEEAVNLDPQQIPEPIVETTEPAETEPEEPEPSPIKKALPFILIGAVVIAAAAAITLILVMRKKKAAAQAAAEAAAAAAQAQAAQDNAFLSDAQFDPGETSALLQDPLPVTPAASQGRQYSVSIVNIPSGSIRMDFILNEDEEVTLGRDQRAQIVLNQEDNKLSGRHFTLSVRGGTYCIRDEKSTNGTYLNGVRIDGGSWRKFFNQDKVRAGSCEYRITILEK